MPECGKHNKKSTHDTGNPMRFRFFQVKNPEYSVMGAGGGVAAWGHDAGRRLFWPVAGSQPRACYAAGVTRDGGFRQWWCRGEGWGMAPAGSPQKAAVAGGQVRSCRKCRQFSSMRLCTSSAGVLMNFSPVIFSNSSMYRSDTSLTKDSGISGICWPSWPLKP